MTSLPTFKKTEFYFSGEAMTATREDKDMTQEEFAAKCGWSRQYQQQLELPGISHHVTDKIFTAFKAMGIVVES